CLVLIGQEWTILRQFTRDHDVVVTEIEEALQQRIVVIPVLVDDAKMPTAVELPSTIRSIAFLQAVRIGRGEAFNADAQSLTQLVERSLIDVAKLRGNAAVRTKSKYQIGIPERPADAAWAALGGSTSSDDLRDFIARFPVSQHVPLARKRMES